MAPDLDPVAVATTFFADHLHVLRALRDFSPAAGTPSEALGDLLRESRRRSEEQRVLPDGTRFKDHGRGVWFELPSGHEFDADGRGDGRFGDLELSPGRVRSFLWSLGCEQPTDEFVDTVVDALERLGARSRDGGRHFSIPADVFE